MLVLYQQIVYKKKVTELSNVIIGYRACKATGQLLVLLPHIYCPAPEIRGFV